MKLKKQYKTMIIIIVIIAFSFFLFKKNDIQISDIFNKNNKLATYTFSSTAVAECDQGMNIDFNSLTMSSPGVVYKDSNYIVIDATYTNLKTTEGPTGYSGYAFINKNGCAVKIEDVTSTSNDNSSLCTNLLEYTNSQESLKYWAEYYNNTFVNSHYCSERIVVPETPNPTCEEKGGEYIDPDDAASIAVFDEVKGETRYQIINAATTTLEGSGYESFAFLIDGCTTPLEDTIYGNGFATEYGNNNQICSAMHSYIVNERSKENINNWNYWAKIYNTYTDKGVRADGSIIVYDICPDDTLITEKKEIECDTATRTEIINNNDVTKAKKYNFLCKEESGFQEIKFSTITLNWQDGWGPNTLGENVAWSGENGIYTIQGIVGQTETITFDTELLNYNYELIGWSKLAECNTTIGTGGLTHNFEYSDSNTTYYACYSGDIFENSLFNADGTKKTGFGENVFETPTCDDTIITNNNITQVPMKQKNRYVKQSNQTITLDPILGQENKYCNVMCTDTVDVYYPNLFETVPAGQYFELMYEPEIKASRTCQTEFRYSTWKADYQTALTIELEKLDALSEAQAKYEAANSLGYDSVGNCGCCCSGEGCTCTGSCKTSYSDTQKAYFYKSGSASATSTSSSASGCGYDEMQDSIYEEINGTKNWRGEIITKGAKQLLQDAETEYETAVNNRIRLEQFNLQCYTTLDSDKSNDIEIKYNDTLGISNNYEIIDDTFTYKTNTAKVNVSTDSFGTKGNYINSIIADTSYYDSTSKITATQLKFLTNDSTTAEFIPNSKFKSTKEFYIVNPNLNFIYNTGEQLTTDNEKSENLIIEGHVKKDTGSYTDSSNYIKDNTTENFTRNFYLEYSKNTSACDTGDDSGVNACSTPSDLSEEAKQNYINFNAYTATKTYRKVEYYFTFHEATEYCSKAQSGEVIPGPTCEGIYSSLSRLNEYTDKNNNKIYLKNNVYPVSLNAINDKYPVKFTLTEPSSTPSINNYTQYSGFTGVYTCNYEITNDALTLANAATKAYQNLKSNTIFRSVSTDSIDPNNRESTGNLGENWLNAKGSAVRKNIQETEKHNTTSNDTYNPINLEYSFTLTPSIIQRIKEYNKRNVSTNYDDFELTCTTTDKRECISDFLTELSQGKVNGTIVQPNYFNINSWNSESNNGLTKIRKTWKYYIQSFEDTDLNSTTCESLGNNLYACIQGKMTLENYNKLYEKWGVLP